MLVLTGTTDSSHLDQPAVLVGMVACMKGQVLRVSSGDGRLVL